MNILISIIFLSLRFLTDFFMSVSLNSFDSAWWIIWSLHINNNPLVKRKLLILMVLCLDGINEFRVKKELQQSKFCVSLSQNMWSSPRQAKKSDDCCCWRVNCDDEIDRTVSAFHVGSQCDRSLIREVLCVMSKEWDYVGRSSLNFYVI